MNKPRKLSSLADLANLPTSEPITKTEPVNTGGLWATIRSAKFMPSPVTLEDLNDIVNFLKENADKRLKDQHKANIDIFKHLPQFDKD